MAKLPDRLNTIQSFSELKELLERSQLKISHWRGRIVVASGCSGYARVADLVAVVMRLIKNRKQLSYEETVEAARCGDMINRLYHKGEYIKMEAIDLRLKYACYFFSFLRDTSFEDDHILGFWDHCMQAALQEGDVKTIQARL